MSRNAIVLPHRNPGPLVGSIYRSRRLPDGLHQRRSLIVLKVKYRLAMPQRHYEKMRNTALFPSYKRCSQAVAAKDCIGTKSREILAERAPSSLRRFDVVRRHYDGFSEVRKS